MPRDQADAEYGKKQVEQSEALRFTRVRGGLPGQDLYELWLGGGAFILPESAWRGLFKKLGHYMADPAEPYRDRDVDPMHTFVEYPNSPASIAALAVKS